MTDHQILGSIGSGSIVVQADGSNTINIHSNGVNATSSDQTNLDLYLGWIRNSCQNIRLQTISNNINAASGTPRLSNVYISLDTRERVATCEDMDGREHRVPVDSIGTSGIQPVGDWELKPMPVEESLAFHKDTILLAGPGEGKTIVLRHLALFLSGGAGATEATWSRVVSEFTGPRGLILPILVSLKDFCAHISYGPTATALWDYIEDHLRPIRQSTELVRGRLAEGEAVLLMDDLDKVPPEKRAVVADAIVDFHNLYESCRYVVTCGETDYHSLGMALAPSFHKVTIAPLIANQVDDFVETWYKEIQILGWPIVEGVDRELVDAIHKHDLVSLVQCPRLLAELIMVYATVRRIPGSRISLFKEVINLLLKSYTNNSSEIQPAVLTRLQIECALREMAFVSLVENDLDATAVKKSRILRAMERQFGDADKAAMFVDLAQIILGITTDTGSCILDFHCPPLQDYLAAEHLASQRDFISNGVDVVRTSFARWHNVFAMAVSLAGPDIGVSAVGSLCPHEPPFDDSIETTSSEQWYDAWMGAEALCELGLSELEHRPERSRILRNVVGWLVTLIQANALNPNERNEVGMLLSILGDPRLGVSSLDLDLVRINRGVVILYLNENTNPFEYNIDYDYYVSRYPVTNAQYAEYLKERPECQLPHDEDDIWDPASRRVKPKFRSHPVVGVSWDDARAFCRWLTERLRDLGIIPSGYAARLPTNPEWTKMYRGGKYLPDDKPNPNAKSIYPWGNEWREGYGNIPMSEFGIPHTTCVGVYPLGATPYGILDACGNVIEWINTSWGGFDPETPGFPSEYDPEDGRESSVIKGLRIVRGGSWLFSEGDAKCACRLDPSKRFPDTGFRAFIAPVNSSGCFEY